ncbi:hypothetical protein [Shewanella surugensis]|uniref:Uncharacterized protein n=1 Tax=Shewanella surugensis TaxID=212020 RepID=A0ABT0LH02_9GAMM|nr:hypothetical protein [Shewanella surugensis]MCL1126612.1 hypothetical protein [Shewanella surugensis]
MKMIHKWQYQGETPKAGRRLVLLQEDELHLALPLVYRLIQPKAILLKPTWFTEKVNNQHSSAAGEIRQREAYFTLEPLLTQLVQQRKVSEDISTPLKEVNQLLNDYFSDLGWRMVRKELSQIKKRQKKSHIELSNDIIFKLRHYMQKHQLDSFDQAIDNLLSEHDATY